MKKEQKTYLLIGIVIIVWGFVGFQIFNYVNPKEEVEQEVAFQKFVPQKQKEMESYEVHTYKRDPFLGKIINQNQPKKRTGKRIVKQEIMFPNLVYNGIVTNGNKNAFIITINGAQRAIRVGEVFKEVKLIRGNETQITVFYKGKRKDYKR